MKEDFGMNSTAISYCIYFCVGYSWLEKAYILNPSTKIMRVEGYIYGSF